MASGHAGGEGWCKSWYFRYTFGEKAKRLKIGPYPGVSLADARTRRDNARSVWPLDATRLILSEVPLIAMTLAQLAELWRDTYLAITHKGWRA